MKITWIKRITAGFMATVMAAVLLPIHTANASDLNGHWAEIVMREWSDEAFLTGYEDGNYYPDANITRAEFMTLVNRMEAYMDESDNVERYVDVPEGSWYYRTVARALEAGYMKGITDNQIAPGKYITRQEAVTIVNRLAGISEDDKNQKVLEQVGDRDKISTWAEGQMAVGIMQGLVTGSDGKLSPLNNITRAEAVVLLNRKYKDIRTLAYPGTYSLNTVKSVVISATPVILENTIVTGDLEISVKGDGGIVTLNNVQVEGSLILRGTNIELKQDSKTEIAQIIKRTAEYKDGVYIGYGIGYGGKLTVTVTIEDGVITSVVVSSHRETSQYLKKIQKVFDAILTQQVSEVDSVSGATRSSKAVIAAVEDALAQARGETTGPGETAGAKISYKGSGHSGQAATIPQKLNYYAYVLESGTFEGTSNGYGGTMKAKVTVADGLISEVDIYSHGETGSYFSAAVRILDSVFENQSTDVDIVSGATKTSHAILSVVENALEGHFTKRAVILPDEDQSMLRETGVLSENELMMAVQLPLISGYYTFTVVGAEGETTVITATKASSDNKVVRLIVPSTSVKLTVENKITAAQLLSYNIQTGVFDAPQIQGIESWTMAYDIVEGWTVTAQLKSGTAGGYLFKLDGANVTLTSEQKNSSFVKISVDEGTNKLLTAYNKDGSERLSAYTIVYKNGHVSAGDDEDRVPAVSPSKVADGTYEGSASAFSGLITLSVTVKDGVITAIDLMDHKETLVYTWESLVILFQQTWNTITTSILADNSTSEVDGVSGATYTSDGIKDAVNNALSKGVQE